MEIIKWNELSTEIKTQKINQMRLDVFDLFSENKSIVEIKKFIKNKFDISNYNANKLVFIYEKEYFDLIAPNPEVYRKKFIQNNENLSEKLNQIIDKTLISFSNDETKAADVKNMIESVRANNELQRTTSDLLGLTKDNNINIEIITASNLNKNELINGWDGVIDVKSE